MPTRYARSSSPSGMLSLATSPANSRAHGASTSLSATRPASTLTTPVTFSIEQRRSSVATKVSSCSQLGKTAVRTVLLTD